MVLVIILSKYDRLSYVMALLYRLLASILARKLAKILVRAALKPIKLHSTQP